MVKNLPAIAGDVKRRGLDSWVRKNPLVDDMATYSSILAWRIPRITGASRTMVHRVAKDMTEVT